MYYFLRICLLTSAVALGTTLVTWDRAIAQQVTGVSSLEQTGQPATPETNFSARPLSSKANPKVSHLSQVTSVSQLSDVQPTDWAFQALQSLVERYGVIAGYPDVQFRGSRALTRYEFAAGLNAALDRVNELIAAGTAGLVTKEDLETLKKLQEDFSAELATLRGRVDALESRTAQLETNQFSTTTKLNGFAWFNVTGAFAGGSILAEGFESRGFGALRDPATGFTQPLTRRVDNNPNTTFSTLAWLNLETSFTGRDALITTLAVGNGDSPPNVFGSAGSFNNYPVPFTDQTPGPNKGLAEVILLESYYRFPVSDSLQFVVGPQVNYYSFFDFNRFTLFFNGASSYSSIENPLFANIKRGAGALALWSISDQFKLNVGYLAQNTEFLPAPFRTATNPSQGLFGGTNSAIAELTYSPTRDASIRISYGRSNIERNPAGQVQTLLSLHGVADDGPGGSPQGGLGNATVDVFSVNFDWQISSAFGIFGRYNYAINHLFPTSGVPNADVSAQAFQIGTAFPDLGKRGAMGTLSFVMPFSVTAGREYLVSGGGNGASQYNLELTYFYPLTYNIAIVPAFYAIFNPNNFSSNPPIYVGNLRTQFRF
ncbi:MAG: iron uptake porin [Leptolyngbyaceae bacterium]|nr:iron uptake porin [Leptolyngbyaceae bacterium]